MSELINVHFVSVGISGISRKGFIFMHYIHQKNEKFSYSQVQEMRKFKEEQLKIEEDKEKIKNLLKMPFVKVVANPGSTIIKAWVDGVPVEEEAWEQVKNLAKMPFVKAIAIMPDIHVGVGSTIGTVFATENVLIPSSVSVDLSCGMIATRTSLKSHQLPDDLFSLRCTIEATIPHGRTNNGGCNDEGSWNSRSNIPNIVTTSWEQLQPSFDMIVSKYPKLQKSNHLAHLGTLGTGNHFIEICIEKDTEDVWLMLHSGSRGVGNAIGQTFINLAKEDMKNYYINLPDQNLAYLPEGSKHYFEYIKAISWAQKYAYLNRQIMMELLIDALKNSNSLPEFDVNLEVINCHHNYISHEKVHGKKMWVTRKGALSAKLGELAIIPGSMGAKSYIVRGKGNYEALNSCSHGAGRKMSRTSAKKNITLEQHIADTQGVECRRDLEVIDESPSAYKDIDAVMAAQKDNVDILHELKQILCVKG